MVRVLADSSFELPTGKFVQSAPLGRFLSPWRILRFTQAAAQGFVLAAIPARAAQQPAVVSQNVDVAESGGQVLLALGGGAHQMKEIPRGSGGLCSSATPGLSYNEVRLGAHSIASNACPTEIMLASIFKHTPCCSKGQVCTAMFRPSPPRFQGPCRAGT